MWDQKKTAVSVLRILTTCAVLASGTAAGQTADRDRDEYQVKAALIFKFFKFVEWPEEALPRPAKRVDLCIVGTNPFGDSLDRLKGREAAGRALEIRRLRPGETLKGCHALYVGQSEKGQIGAISKEAADHHVLTVGDTAGFARKGLAVNFYIEDDSVRFEINREAARLAGITVSAKLLRLAKLVENQPDLEGGAR